VAKAKRRNIGVLGKAKGRVKAGSDLPNGVGGTGHGAAATQGYTRLHQKGLTVAQQNAIDLLAAGKDDTETARQVGVHRVTVSRWRLYSPTFQAALNGRRAEVWSSGCDLLRSLIPKALTALAEEMDKPDSPNRVRAAAEILHLAQLPAKALKVGPTDPEKIVRQTVEQRPSQVRTKLEDLLDEGNDLPPFERHLADTWRELEELASGSKVPAVIPLEGCSTGDS
jgi:hypothetical protein